MPRKLPNCPDLPPHSSTQVQETYTIHVVTPLFGGGVEAGVNDPIGCIRGTTIRGHLRFWWRATRGAAFTSIQDLQKREAEIWGSSKVASPVMVRINVLSKGLTRKCANFVSGKNYTQFINDYSGPLSYALFPFQGGVDKYGERQEPALASENVKFELVISAPTQQLLFEAKAALWAWINFGGVGARTRRGCGSLYCKAFSPNKESINDISSWYESNIKIYSIDRKSVLWTTLPLGKRPSFIIQKMPMDHLQSWQKMIGYLRYFRQGSGFARNVGKDHPGRSHWPEAESIRAITGDRSPNHHEMGMPVPFFPRAALGLPIVFHFKDAKEPNETQLEPQDTNRMASPVILKALAFSETKSVPMALFMRRPNLSGVKINTSPPFQGTKDDVVTNVSMTTYANSPMNQLDGNKNKLSKNGAALVAFANFLADRMKG
jgi:CRISPR-associated protein Cmr1